MDNLMEMNAMILKEPGHLEKIQTLILNSSPGGAFEGS